jgi:hypothetical protein
MAKRKRLTPFGDPALPEDATQDLPPDLETKAMFTRYPQGYAGTYVRPAPIADMAGAAAATAAMEEMAEVLRNARESGRMVLALPLDQVQADHLMRDRIALDDDEMTALVDSLRARGQQTPVEVVALGPERYGLISGWRRLKALRQLLAETGDAGKYGSVLALLRQPEQASDAYVAMVEENELRVGLSFYERARIVAKAVEAGVYADDRSALRGLFGSVPRARRSKIGSFLTVVRALDGALRFPETISEKLGLALAQRIEADPALPARLLSALEAKVPATAEAEQAVLSRLGTVEKPSQKAVTETVLSVAPGLRLRDLPGGGFALEGDRADAALRVRLLDWLRQQ